VADGLLDQGQFAAAMELLKLASPVLAARAADKTDVKARLERNDPGSMFDLGVANLATAEAAIARLSSDTPKN